MNKYIILKRLYNGRVGRILQPDETMEFDDQQAMILLRHKLIKLIQREVVEKRVYKRKPDPEIGKIRDL